MKRILILGFSGYLGKEVQKNLGPENVYMGVSTTQKDETIKNISPFDITFRDDIRKFRPDIVLNMAASWINPTKNKDQMEFSNYILPILVAEIVMEFKPIWYQVNSYYNYFFDEFGYDKDIYSALRRQATDYLRTRFDLIEFHLPHILGSDDKPFRIFPVIINSLLSNIAVDLTSGNQFLPILHVCDAARIISSEIENPLTRVIDIKPTACETIKSFALQINKILVGDFNLLKFGMIPDSPNEIYKKETITSHYFGKSSQYEVFALQNIKSIILSYVTYIQTK